MKTTVATVALAAALPLVMLRAADARVFEGVNLDELKQTQRLGGMPQIYERDPDNPPRFRLRKAVVQIPLGTAWLSFNAELNMSYLNKVPGENAAVYFGPVAGDAFELFKLEERFTNALIKEYQLSPDVEYRLALMVRTGNEKLRERALRIMTAALATNVSLSARTFHLPRFREIAATMEGDDVAPLRAAIAETEERFSESIPTLPDSAYSPGNDELARQGKLQDWMKPGVAVPDAAWGEALNGLRAAAAFSTTEVKPGDEISVWLLVENASDKEIRFTTSDIIQQARPKITRADGTEIQAKWSWYTGLSPRRHHKLKPGERLTLAKKTLFFDDKDSTNSAGFGSNRAASGPGEYRVRYESGQMNGYAKGDWGGQLATAETKVIVLGDARAAVGEPKFVPPPVAAAPATAVPAVATPANKERAGTKAILVNVIDAAGKPIPEFRVIAGVKSSASAKGEKEIINWQPHTLRAGTDGALTWPLAKAYDPMALRVEADGYAPQSSAWLEKKNPKDVEFRLTEDKGMIGRVLMPDGNPAANATVALAMVQRDAVLEGGKLRQTGMPQPEKESDQWRWPRFTQTDERGQFRLPAENDPTAALLVTHEGGVREMSLADFKQGVDGMSLDGLAVRHIKLQAWGRIEGRAQWGNAPGANRSVSLSIHRDSYGYPGVIAQGEKTTTSANGDFVFEHVLPGLAQLSCPVPATPDNKSGTTEVNLPGMITHLTVQPGKNSALLGGQGRTVKGRLTGRESYADVTFHFHPTAPHFGLVMDNEMWSAWSALQKSPVGPIFFRDGLKVNADGTFEIAAVLPGDYQIFFTHAGEKEHLATGKFVVPAEKFGAKPEAHNIEELRCRGLP